MSSTMGEASSAAMETRPRRRLLGDPRTGAFTIILTLAGLALLGPLAAPYGPYDIFPAGPWSPPSRTHVFGTDQNAMDVLSRVLHAARLDLGIALASTLVTLALAFPLGIGLGYFNNRRTQVALRVLDMVQAFPALIVALVTLTLIGGGPVTVVLTAAFLNVPIVARVIRAVTLSVSAERFIEAAIASGSSDGRIIRRHVAPHVMGAALVQGAITLSSTLILVTALSFIGVGIQAPQAEWGAMIQEGSKGIVNGLWWAAVFPGLAITFSVLLTNRLGDRLNAIFSGEAR